jgi:hypothetical protein
MTPKEKAKELTLKFMKIDSDSEKFDEFEMKLFYAQRCALIAVDEILDADIPITESEYADSFYDYWQEVKQEIQAL